MKLLLILFILCALGTTIQKAYAQEDEHITKLEMQLEQGGINAMIDAAQKNGWSAPSIPSQWKVDHVSNPDHKSDGMAARSFGKSVAKQLEDTALLMQQLPSTDKLYEQTMRLCNLSEWFAATEGYGNMFLAQRALDLAAVGVARLAANLDFPVEKVNALRERIKEPSWMSLQTRWQVLNQDAGEQIFPIAQQEDIQETWSSGKLLLLESRNPQRKAQRATYSSQFHIRETPEVLRNLSFFDDLDVSQVNPFTLAATWDKNWHEAFVVRGFGLQSVEKAQALAEFRANVGQFPNEKSFTDAELQKIKEWSDQFSKKHQINRVVTPQGTFDSIGQAAFAKAWQEYLDKAGTNLSGLPPKQLNLDVTAWQAYDEVKNGRFLDHDSQQIEITRQKTGK